MMKGVDLTENMYAEKRRMYREIFQRVKEIRDRNPDLPLGDIVFDVVNSEAPSSYITPDRAYRLIKN